MSNEAGAVDGSRWLLPAIAAHAIRGVETCDVAASVHSKVVPAPRRGGILGYFGF